MYTFSSIKSLVFITSLSASLAIASPAEHATLKQVSARVTVSAEGKISKLEWSQPETMSSSVESFLRPQLESTSFDPAKQGGVPVESTLLLTAILRATPRADGQLTLSLFDIQRGGPSYKIIRPPQYPTAMQNQGISGIVLMKATVGADGSVIPDSIGPVEEPKGRHSSHLREFIKAARRSISEATFTDLETVAGLAIPTEVRIPMVFCLNGCDALYQEAARFRKEQNNKATPEQGTELAQFQSPVVDKS